MLNYEELSQSIYLSYGKFALKFEEVRINVKEVLARILHAKGLTDSTYTEMVFANQTADPLRALLLSFSAEYFRTDSDSLKLMQKVCLKLKDAIELRNVLIHSFWAMGYGNTPAETLAVAIRPKTTKSGLAYHDLNYYSKDFQMFADRLDSFAEILNEITQCIDEGKPLTERVSLASFESIDLNFKSWYGED